MKNLFLDYKKSRYAYVPTREINCYFIFFYPTTLRKFSFKKFVSSISKNLVSYKWLVLIFYSRTMVSGGIYLYRLDRIFFSKRFSCSFSSDLLTDIMRINSSRMLKGKKTERMLKGKKTGSKLKLVNFLA